MDKEKIIITFVVKNKQICDDIEVPINITANELVIALNSAYELGIDVTDIKNCYLKAERPIALLKGNKTLCELGIRTGSVISYSE